MWPDPGTGSRTEDRSGSVLELRLADVRQIFDSLDPAPFRERDLDPKAAAYIVEWAQEQPPHAALVLTVHLGHGGDGTAALLADAVHEYFRGRALATRRKLRRMFHVGRISLVIGIACLGAAIAIAEAVTGWVSKDSYGGLIKESLIIGGWVALWRPMEIFLYDWWPLRSEIRLYERLVRMPVKWVAGTVTAGAGP